MKALALLLGALAVSAAPSPVLSPNKNLDHNQVPLQGPQDPPRGVRGGVASESKECSAIGRDILADGGNAVDVIVGTTLCVGVVGMYHSGLGGGGFMLIRTASGDHEAIDFRETAPAAAYSEMYRGNSNGSMVGGLAVAIPGEPRGLEYAHRRHGVLPWKRVVREAVRVAREGFVVSADTVRYMERFTQLFGHGRDFLVDDPGFAQDFAPNGRLLREGEIMTRKRYADTLERIGEHGADAFYTGPVAESIVAAVNARNGSLTLDDLRNYNISLREPIVTTFRGKYRLVSVPAPAGGAVALQILKIMEQYPPTAPYFDKEDANYHSASSIHARQLATHRLAEAMRFAYAARMHLADPAFEPSTLALEKRMLDPQALRRIHDTLCDDSTLPIDEYGPDGVYAPGGRGTSQVVAADVSGMTVTLTSTINAGFGALFVDPLSGVILNNEMDDFSKPGQPNFFGLAPSPENYARAGKRPLSSISPVIVERIGDDDGSSSLYLSIGAAGGSRISTATAQVIWRLLEGHTTSLRDAVAAPRIHNQLLPNVTALEPGYDEATAESLQERGHDVQWDQSHIMSAIHALTMDENGKFVAVGEPRQLNSAGYVL